MKPKNTLLALIASGLLLSALHATAYAAGPDSDETEPSAAAYADLILGYWQRGEGEAVIEVRQHVGGYHGVIVASERRPEIVGVEVFRQLRYDEDTSTWHGRAYSIKRKREVRIDIVVPDANRLELTAHVLIFSRRVQFNRIPAAGLARLRLR
jgi:hypothetical protein